MTSLERYANRVYVALNSQWATRAELAQRLGKKYLSNVETLALDDMAETGKIERRQQPGDHPGALRFEYRLKPGNKRNNAR